MTFFYQQESPVGTLTATSNGEQITGLWIAGQKYAPEWSQAIEKPELSAFRTLSDWLNCYFQGEPMGLFPLLAPAGSPFRQLVWQQLCAIPYGSLISYGRIAKEIELLTGKRQSSQAVGGAVGHNPISILIPCHRVVGSDGSLTGYAGGLDKKIKLLEIEKVSFDHLYVPTKGTAL